MEESNFPEEILKSHIQYNPLVDVPTTLADVLLNVEEKSIPNIDESIEIDLKCAEKVTDSDVDDVEDTKTNGKHQRVRNTI